MAENYEENTRKTSPPKDRRVCEQQKQHKGRVLAEGAGLACVEFFF
jgi:hypothetical protein